MGAVVFVRHSLPGERVVATVTSTTSSFIRADATDVLRASPDRVTPPCPYAGPGRCGGCDFQHIDPAAQRRLKASRVAEQLQRVAGVTRAVRVDHVARRRGRARLAHPRPAGRRPLRTTRIPPASIARAGAGRPLPHRLRSGHGDRHLRGQLVGSGRARDHCGARHRRIADRSRPEPKGRARRCHRCPPASWSTGAPSNGPAPCTPRSPA